MAPGGLAGAFMPAGTIGAGHANGHLRAGLTATAAPTLPATSPPDNRSGRNDRGPGAASLRQLRPEPDTPTQAGC